MFTEFEAMKEDDRKEKVRSSKEQSDELGVRQLRMYFVYTSSFSLNARAALIAT